MSLESDLNPRLELIRRLVREQYARYLQKMQRDVQPPGRIILNEAGEIVPEPTATEATPQSQATLQEALRQWGRDWQNTSIAVNELVSKVQAFYAIDRDNGVLENIWKDLGQGPRQQGPQRDAGYAPHEDGGSVYAELAYARYFVDKEIYNQLLGIRHEIPLDGNNQPERHPDGSGHPNGSVTIELDTDDWDGPTARVFFWQFSVPFDQAAARQLEYVRQISANIHCLRMIREYTKLSIRKVIDNCIRSLGGTGEVEPMVPEENILDALGDRLGDANAVAGFVFSALGLIMSTGGASILVGALGVGSASISIYQIVAAKDEGSDDVDLNVAPMAPEGSPYPVILSTQDAIGRLNDWLSRKDDCIGKGLERDMASGDSLNSSKLWLHEPGDVSEGIHGFSLKPDIGQARVKVSIANLRRAGETLLPGTVAGHYDKAKSKLSECSLPDWVAIHLGRTYHDIHAARDALGHLLRTTANNLEMWGDELVDIACDYDQTDRDNAETVGGTMD